MNDQGLKRITVAGFSVFKEMEAEFCSGINVFIGENATGKTHLLKLIYCMLKPFEATQQEPGELPTSGKARLNQKLLGVFRPEGGQPGRLLTRSRPVRPARVRLHYGRQTFVEFGISEDGRLRPLRRSVSHTPASLFIPPREMLASYDGFIATYDNRELAFDETYYDLCKAMTGTLLRGDAKAQIEPILREIEGVLGGRVIKHGGRFYVGQTGRRDIEASLLAEGHRKMATLHRLLSNGALRSGMVLLLDEPEASLNPKLVKRMVDILRRLAECGVQIFVATHDFLLTQELSLAAEYRTEPKIPIRFFAFGRAGAGSSVNVEASDDLADLKENAILHEFAAHYDREQALFAADTGNVAARRGR